MGYGCEQYVDHDDQPHGIPLESLNDMDITFYIIRQRVGGIIWIGQLYVVWKRRVIQPDQIIYRIGSFTALAGTDPVDDNVVSDPFSFTFLPGWRYDIGVLGSTGTLKGSFDIQNGTGNINTTQGGFESINRNANLVPVRSNYGYAGVDPHIRLISDTAVPEPSTFALLGIGGIALLGGYARRGKNKRLREVRSSNRLKPSAFMRRRFFVDTKIW